MFACITLADITLNCPCMLVSVCAMKHNVSFEINLLYFFSAVKRLQQILQQRLKFSSSCKEMNDDITSP